MKKQTDETSIKAVKAVRMHEGGYSMRHIAEEVGMSVGWVQKTIKNPPVDETEGHSDDDDENKNSDSSAKDYTTSKIILTSKQRKYLEERKQRAIVYSDTSEGWLISLSDAQMYAVGSVSWWSAIVYPDSAPDNWRERLDATGMQWAESPVHDKDKWDHDNPAGLGELDGKEHYFEKGELYKIGDPKKVHIHIMGKCDKPMKYSKLCRLIQDITHGTIPKELFSLSGYYDYLTHLHNPEKYPYWKEEKPVNHNGFVVELNTTERKKVQLQITNTIHKKRIDTWGKLMKEYKDSYEYMDVIAMRHGFFKNSVDNEYYKYHPEARIEYSRKQQADQIKQLKQLSRISDLLDIIITGEDKGNG